MDELNHNKNFFQKCAKQGLFDNDHFKKFLAAILNEAMANLGQFLPDHVIKKIDINKYENMLAVLLIFQDPLERNAEINWPRILNGIHQALIKKIEESDDLFSLLERVIEPALSTIYNLLSKQENCDFLILNFIKQCLELHEYSKPLSFKYFLNKFLYELFDDIKFDLSHYESAMLLVNVKEEARKASKNSTKNYINETALNLNKLYRQAEKILFALSVASDDIDVAIDNIKEKNDEKSFNAEQSFYNLTYYIAQLSIKLLATPNPKLRNHPVKMKLMLMLMLMLMLLTLTLTLSKKKLKCTMNQHLHL